MPSATLEIPAERDLLSRLATGTAGVVGAAFLRRLVTELAAALDAEVAFVAELIDDRPGWARIVAGSGVDLREGDEAALADTPWEHAYVLELVRCPEGARRRYPRDCFLAAHGATGCLALALRAADGTAIGHIGVISTQRLDPGERELDALRIFAARAAAEVERRRDEAALRLRAEQVIASRTRAVQAADEERRRLGRDLHDGAQRRLVDLGESLDLALRDLAGDPARTLRRLTDAREQATLAGDELRDLARGLHPVGLERGLAAALAQLAAQSPLPLRIVALPPFRLPRVVEATIWFIVSEALENTLEHADASVVAVEVAQLGHTLVVEVSDDGAGGATLAGGNGLQGLAARVESLGGRLDIDSPPAMGTRLAALIPLASYRVAEPAAH